MTRLFFILSLIMTTVYASAQEYKWRFGLSGSASYVTASSKEAERSLIDAGMASKDAKDFYKTLKWGQSLDIDAHYLFQANMGVGLKYHLFTSSSKKNNLAFDTDGDGYIEMLNIDERMYYNFIGPSFYMQTRFNSESPFQFTAQIAIGSLHSRDEARSIYNIVATGGTIGMNSEIGIEYFCSKNISIGATLSSMVGTIGKVTLNDGYQSQSGKLSGDNKINLAHLNLGLGIRFYK